MGTITFHCTSKMNSVRNNVVTPSSPDIPQVWGWWCWGRARLVLTSQPSQPSWWCWAPRSSSLSTPHLTPGSSCRQSETSWWPGQSSASAWRWRRALWVTESQSTVSLEIPVLLQPSTAQRKYLSSESFLTVQTLIKDQWWYRHQYEFQEES